jgi:type IV pilus assembly protein PilA
MNNIIKIHISKKEKVQGFTLIELIISIAILGIISAIAIPKFISYIDSSREAACLSNRRIANSAYLVYLANGGSIIEDNLSGTQFLVDSGDLFDEIVCPSGGTYSWILDSNENAFISCSVHTPSDELGDILLDIVVDLLTSYSTSELWELIGKYPSNDNIREYILNTYFNGSWPSLSVDLPDKFEGTLTSDLKIMPFSNTKDLSDPVIYASTNTGNSWNATVFYYPGDGWYIHKNSYNSYTGITFSSYTGTNIKNLIDSNPSEWESLN